MPERLPFASGLPAVIPKALNHPPRVDLGTTLTVAEKRKLSRPYQRSKAAVRAAVKRANAIMGERDDD